MSIEPSCGLLLAVTDGDVKFVILNYRILEQNLLCQNDTVVNALNASSWIPETCRGSWVVVLAPECGDILQVAPSPGQGVQTFLDIIFLDAASLKALTLGISAQNCL